MRIYNVDARVCYLGINTDTFDASTSKKQRFVIGLGSLTWNKRPMFALQCIAAIPKERRPKLVWVGNYGFSETIVREAARMEVDFVYRELVSDTELKELLSRAAVMIYVSHLEPFGYAPLEANACGTAVVALAEGGIRESMHPPESGTLISSLDTSEFAHALLSYCDDLEYASESGKRARDHVLTHWSSDAARQRLEQELKRAITVSI